MSENMEENQNKDKINSQESHSNSSHHRHHSGHEEHSHGYHHSHSGRSRSRSYSSKSSEQSDNIPAEYSKRKKRRLWRRSLFISLICVLFVILVFMIVNAENENNLLNGFISGRDRNNTEEIQIELDSLRAENMNLKYELEKYKDKYGDLDAAEEDNAKTSGTSKKAKTTK